MEETNIHDFGPQFGQIVALEMYLGILARELYVANPQMMESFDGTLEWVQKMDKSRWLLSPEQQQQWDIAWDELRRGIEGKYPMF